MRTQSRTQSQARHCLACDCARVIGNLLLLSGDIEINPGPGPTKAELEAQVKQLDCMHELMRKLETNVTVLATGQAALKADVEAILGKQAQLETSVAALNSFEKEILSITQAKADICNLQHSVAMQFTATEVMLSRLDFENRSRRCNLIFYGKPDAAGESWSSSERKVLEFASEKLGVTLDNSHLERAHRLETQSREKNRPIIASVSSYITKKQLLLCGPKLRGFPFSMSEDFLKKVHVARQRLLAFAKSQGGPKPRFDKLHMGSKVFLYDSVFDSVASASA